MSDKKDSSENPSRRSLLKSTVASAGVIVGSTVPVSADTNGETEPATELADYIRDHGSGVLSYLRQKDVLGEFDVDVGSLTNEEWVAENRKQLESFDGKHGVIVTKRFTQEGFVTPIQITLTNETQKGEFVVVPEQDKAYFIKQPREPYSTTIVHEGVRRHQTEYRFISDEEQVSAMVEAQQEKNVQTERIGTQDARIQGCVLDVCAAGAIGPNEGVCVTKKIYCPGCSITLGKGCGYDCNWNNACTPWYNPCERFSC